MKKLSFLFVTALAAAGLASCGNGPTPTSTSAEPTTSETSSVTSETTTTSPTPEKTDWTNDEKAIMADWLLVNLPFSNNLELTEELSTLQALGDVATDAMVTSYGAKLEALNFIEESGVWDSYDGSALFDFDVYEVADYDENDEPIFYRRQFSRAGYFPIYGQIVAVGKESGTGKLLVTATIYQAVYEAQFSVDNYGFPIDDEQTLEGIYGMFAAGDVYLCADESTPDEEVEERIAKFGTIECSTAEYAGIDDLGYMNPWTLGNFYSEDFMPMQAFYVVGGEQEDIDAYLSDLADIGYQEMSGGILALNADEGIYLVSVTDLLEPGQLWSEDAGFVLQIGFMPAIEE